MGPAELVVAAAVAKHDNIVKSQVIPEQQAAPVISNSLSPHACRELAQTGAVEEVTGGVVMVTFCTVLVELVMGTDDVEDVEQ